MSERDQRVMRALSRFDSATANDLAEVLGTSEAARRAQWRALKRLVEAGLIERTGITYRMKTGTNPGKE